MDPDLGMDMILNTTIDHLNTIYRASNVTLAQATQSLEALIDWCNKQPHFPKNVISEVLLKRFLGAGRYKVEEIKERMENFLTMRGSIPQIFTNRNPHSVELIQSMKEIEWVMMPFLTEECYRVSIIRFKECDVNIYNPRNVFKLAMMIADIRMHCEICLGDIFVIDLEHFKLGQALKVPLTIIKQFTYITTNCYPTRVKGVHFLNLHSYVQNFINIIKSTMKKKIADRIRYHNSIEELHKYIPLHYLPAELGGMTSTCTELSDNLEKAIQSDYWTKWFLESDKMKTDESRRPHMAPDRASELTGIIGSFRKLDID